MAAPTTADYENYIEAVTGYVATDDDDVLIKYIAENETQHILNDTAQDVMPEELVPVLRDYVVGRFIQIRKADIIGSDGLAVFKSLSEGDVSVTFGGSTAEARLDELIATLTKERDLKCFRKFRW